MTEARNKTFCEIAGRGGGRLAWLGWHKLGESMSLSRAGLVIVWNLLGAGLLWWKTTQKPRPVMGRVEFLINSACISIESMSRAALVVYPLRLPAFKMRTLKQRWLSAFRGKRRSQKGEGGRDSERRERERERERERDYKKNAIWSETKGQCATHIDKLFIFLSLLMCSTTLSSLI